MRGAAGSTNCASSTAKGNFFEFYVNARTGEVERTKEK